MYSVACRQGSGGLYLSKVCGIDPCNMRNVENGCQGPAASTAGPETASGPFLQRLMGDFLISASHLEASACVKPVNCSPGQVDERDICRSFFFFFFTVDHIGLIKTTILFFFLLHMSHYWLHNSWELDYFKFQFYKAPTVEREGLFLSQMEIKPNKITS